MKRADSQRVAVTGLGLITPLGLDVPSSWAALVAGQSGVGPITRFDASDLKTQIAAEVKGFQPEELLDPREARRLDRFAQFALVAAQQAVADAGADLSQRDPYRVGVVMGSAIGGVSTLLEQAEILRERGPRRMSPYAVPALMLKVHPDNTPALNAYLKAGFSAFDTCPRTGHTMMQMQLA